MNRDLFNLRQNGGKVSDYFTGLSSLWEEIESMNILPTVTTMTAEVTEMLKAMEKIKEEAKLFQFLKAMVHNEVSCL